MPNMRLSVAARNGLAQVLTDLVDAGEKPGSIKLYSGDQPPSANDPANGKLLGTLVFSKPCSSPPIGGLADFLDITEESSAPSSGKAAWARIYDGDGNPVFDCDVSGPSGGGTIELNTTAIVKGGPIRISDFSILMPTG